MIKFNINHDVWVRLTDRGKKIADLEKAFYCVDEFGWSKFQLWDLMNIFGPHIYNGCYVPFETEILIDTREHGRSLAGSSGCNPDV